MDIIKKSFRKNEYLAEPRKTPKDVVKEEAIQPKEEPKVLEKKNKAEKTKKVKSDKKKIEV